MFRRCVRDLSSVRSIRKTTPITPTHYLLSPAARNGFSTGVPQHSSPAGKERNKSKGGLLIGALLGLTIGGGLAYRNGKLDFLFSKSVLENASVEQNEVRIEEKKEAFEVPAESKTEEIVISESEKQADVDLEKEIKSEEGLNLKDENDKNQSENLTTVEEMNKDKEDEIVVNENTSNSDEIINKTEKNEEFDEELVKFLIEDIGAIESSSVPINKSPETKNSLLESYSLQESKSPESIPSQNDETADVSNPTNDKTADVSARKDKTETEKESIMLDLIEAIHTAERKQAESDAYIFAEEKRRLKEKYEKELKDTRVREVMFAEEVAMLEKELNKEKARALSAIKSLQEKAEQTLKEQLQLKDEEIEKEFEKINELKKAELAASIAKEKALQIERISEANLNINALCMAFYARSEEARQTHSVHNLALAVLGMEEALSKGLPLKQEIDSLRDSLQSIDKDSLLQLAVSSLPKEALEYGTDTQMDLSIKFNVLKGVLRHFSLIPAGGGGILTHAIATLASSIKMREGDESKDGIEPLISRVETLIKNGELAEAADELELGLQDTEAEAAVKHWIRQARVRAISEQTLSLLQSYASSVS